MAKALKSILQVMDYAAMIDLSTIIAIVAILAVLAAMSVRRIPEGHVYTLRRLGRPASRLLMPGVHMVWPLLERIAHKISLGGRTLSLQGPDTQPARVYWQVLDPARAEAVIERADALIGDELNGLWPRFVDIDTPLRCQQLKQQLNMSLRPRGLMITRVDLDQR